MRGRKTRGNFGSPKIGNTLALNDMILNPFHLQRRREEKSKKKWASFTSFRQQNNHKMGNPRRKMKKDFSNGFFRVFFVGNVCLFFFVLFCFLLQRVSACCVSGVLFCGVAIFPSMLSEHDEKVHLGSPEPNTGRQQSAKQRLMRRKKKPSRPGDQTQVCVLAIGLGLLSSLFFPFVFSHFPIQPSILSFVSWSLDLCLFIFVIEMENPLLSIPILTTQKPLTRSCSLRSIWFLSLIALTMV